MPRKGDPGICAFQVAGMWPECATRVEISEYPFNSLTFSPVTSFSFLPPQSSAHHLPQDGIPPSGIPSSHPSLPKDTWFFTSSSELTSSKKTPLIFSQSWTQCFLQLHGGIIYIPYNPPIISGDNFSECIQLLNYHHNAVLECSHHPHVWWQPIPTYIPRLRQPLIFFLYL